MTRFQGFKTKDEAVAFQKKHGGLLCYDKRTPKTNRPTGVGIDYGYAVHLGGLDPEKYPFCLQWNER